MRFVAFFAALMADKNVSIEEMEETLARPESPRTKALPGLSLVGGTAAFFLIQYGLALWNLGNSTGGMRNKFSALAKEEYLGFLIRENLRMLVAYALLTAGAAFLCRPLVALTRWRGRWACAGSAFVVTAGLHGLFTLRLMMTRPYFVNPLEFGKWYFKWIEWVPETVKPGLFLVLFTCLPVGLVVWAVVRDFRRAGMVGRTCMALVVAICIGLACWKPWITRAPEVAATANDLPNVIIIGSDSLRGDRLGCAGHLPSRSDGAAAAGVSPNIDSLAARSTRFQNCYTSIASTMESGVQLMSSQYPHSHGIRQMYPDKATVEATTGRIEPLASVLGANGYETAAVGDWCAGYYHVLPLGFDEISVSSFDNFRIYMSQAVVMAHFVVPLYFDNALGYLLFPQLQSFAQFVTPEVVTRRVEERIARAASGGRPFFWHVFYSCNHLPYRSKEPYASMFTDPDYAGRNRSGVDFDIDHFIGGTDLESKWSALPAHEVRQIRSLYDGCTRQFDDCVGRILDALKTTGLDRNTIVIVTADHGDDLYEAGVTLGHGLTLNGALHSCHVPLIVHVPGAEAREIASQIRMIDVAPTILDLLGIPPPRSWEGRSFAPWLSGAPPDGDRALYAETGFPFIQFRVAGVERPSLPPMDEMTMIDEDFGYQFVLKPEYRDKLVAAKQRCLKTGRWKLVCTPTADGSRHYGLFHMATDPDGERDLSASRPEVLAPMRKALDRWTDLRMETPLAEIFPGGEP